MLVKIV
jgi:hypothetical protein